MPRSFEITSIASTAILTTSEAKGHLRVDTTADDAFIDNLIQAATDSAEIYTNRFFIDTTLTLKGDKWSDIEYLFKSPVLTITSIQYYDSDNALQTLASSVYLLDNSHQPARVTLDEGESYPNLASRANAVKIIYNVGYGTASSDVPDGIKQAVLLTVGHWYQNREDVVVGRIASQLPMAAKYLLDQYKVQTL
ncbi:MAG: phage head-tail connector protein [Flavobacteriales bacterium]|nr:phage head-tail connector protein [Flavobacteriales bacterium]